MNRRAFIGTLAGGLLAAPLAVEAQQTSRAPMLGYLAATSETVARPNLEAFQQRLRELGYVEGRNIVFEYRYAGEQLDRLGDLAQELVQLKVDIIVTGTTPAIRAAQQATKIVPIVMTTSADAVGTGLIANLARPGGNTTGVTLLIPELSGKRLEVPKAALPGASRVGVLWNSTGPAGALALRETQVAAHTLGLEVLSLEVRTSDDFDRISGLLARTRVDALFVIEGPFVAEHRGRVTDLATRTHLPAIGAFREFAESGGLIGYGPSRKEMYREAAVYVDKILRGAKPGDLPVQQPTKFELVINLKTAKALGLTIPQSLLQRADQVIE
jgi:putative ABC transport system substrate-binding protein